ncbi:MAG: asparagine--tRNA ligase [Candidatus Walczuchella monophlebidarum]
MKVFSIKELLYESTSLLTKEVFVNGWVKSFRSRRFIDFNDGSTIKYLQIVIEGSKFDEDFLKKITIGIALRVFGTIVISLGKKQSIEILAKEIKIYSEIYHNDLRGTILQPKHHSLEKLREQAHLRFRTRLFSAILRIRHQLAFSIHHFFHKQNFYYIQTPIITTSDAEGAGQMFRITSFKLENITNHVDDFFGCSTYLTVSGQLAGETAAMALGKIYTFGPTFRAENSNTSRHLSEFWMVEPEMAFYELEDNMDLAETLLKSLLNDVLNNCVEDLDFLNWYFIKKKFDVQNIVEILYLIKQHSFARVSYSEAIEILLSSNKKGKFKYSPQWGMDLQSEHERFLVEKYFGVPVIIFDYPADIKAFYMRINDDSKTVRAMDVLFPRIGEIIGGSQREERYDILLNRLKAFNIDEKVLWWYLDTRRFGSAPHSGFGLGLERLVQFTTGMSNIRDVIPYPRTPKHADF